MARVYHILCLAAATVALPCSGQAAPPDYLIVHAAQLAEAANHWSDYRTATGRRVATFTVPAAAPDATRELIRKRISEFAAAHTGSTTPSVLLLGDAGQEDAAIPTWLFPQVDPTLRSPRDSHYATDHPYQLPERPGGPPRIALGRIPARTNEEAWLVLDKVERYEDVASTGSWRRRVTYVAGEGRFGPADKLLEGMFRTMVERLVPPAYDVTMTYAKPTSIYCPAPARLSSTVLERLGESALLFNYVGHGTARSFDDLFWNGRAIPMLDVGDVRSLEGTPSALPIALLACCSAGWYDLPHGEICLAEDMLLHPAGPVAVIAGSRPTHPYANTVLQKDLTTLLLVDGVETVGELDLRTMQAMLEVGEDDRDLDMLAAPIALAMRWPVKLGGLRRMHVQLYNLLGDPATRIARPNGRIEELRVQDGRVTGRIDAMHMGVLHITIETARTEPEHAHLLLPVSDRNDPELEAKAARNYALANAVVLKRHGGFVNAGRFDVALDDPLPANAAVVKVYASGKDEDDRIVEAFDAIVLDASGPAGE